MCHPIILAKQLAEFDQEHECLQNSLLHQTFLSLETSHSPPMDPVGKSRRSQMPTRGSGQATWQKQEMRLHGPVTAATQYCQAQVSLLLMLRLLLLTGFLWPFLHCTPHQQAAYTMEPAQLQHSLAELCHCMQWCHVFTLTHVSPWLCHSFLLQKAIGLQSSKTPTEYKKTSCLRK